jgi:hypothetical protein
MGEKNLRSVNDMFLALSNKEIEEALSYAFHHTLTLVGKCEDGTIIIVKLKSEGSSFSQIQGLLKSSARVKHPQEVIFSLIVDETKYLFNATFTLTHGKNVTITPLTRLYSIQRRSNDRLNIPDHFFALAKFSYMNNRPFRHFGKLKDISLGGMGIIFRGKEPKIKAGDLFRGTSTLTNHPPIDFEVIVKHVRTQKNEAVEMQIFGTAFYPEGSTLHVRRITSVVSDIYRDLFKTIKSK